MYSPEITKALGKVREGDRVSVAAGSRKHEGILMPPRNPGFVVLKLDNGYNIGVKFSKSMKIGLLSRGKSPAPSAQKAKRDPSKPGITIIHTGGTIASRVDYRTG